jgi:hypothetical protein
MSNDFLIENYGREFSKLLAAAPLNELGPGRPVVAMKPVLQALASPEALIAAFAPHVIANRDMANACLAGLWLRFDFLDESHAVSQELHNSTGSFWHGIMHRREPDYGNAKYWFRRIGHHAVFKALCGSVWALAATVAAEPAASFLVRQNHWDSSAFVDLVLAAIGQQSTLEKLCREIQRREWELLFDYSFRMAIGKTER